MRMTKAEALTLDSQPGFVFERNVNGPQRDPVGLAVTEQNGDNDDWRGPVVESFECLVNHGCVRCNASSVRSWI